MCIWKTANPKKGGTIIYGTSVFNEEEKGMQPNSPSIWESQLQLVVIPPFGGADLIDVFLLTIEIYTIHAIN